jgi:predicted nucleic acid-binding protein
MKTIISNSSPLIALEQLDLLALLHKFFGTVLIPPAVTREVAPTVTLPDWVIEQTLSQAIGPQILAASLGAGESEALSLALELRASLLILDERPARRLAAALDIPVIGTLGLLLKAKNLGLIAELKPHLAALLNHDFRISSKLYAQVLKTAGELP